MQLKKRYLYGLIILALIVVGTFNFSAQAKSKEKYFASDNLFYHVVKGSKVEVCAAKPTKGTLTIPEKVSYNGKTYKVIGIADHKRVYKTESIEDDDGESVDLNMPGYYYYGYYRKDDKLIPDGMEWIPGSEISKVILPASLTYIGEGAFCGCNSLKTVVFAKKYKSLKIGNNAFCGKKLKKLSFPIGTMELGENAAGTTPTIEIPGSVRKIGAGVVNSKTKKLVLDKKNKNYKLKNGILYTKNEKKLVGISDKAGTNITISSKTTSIEERAFAGSKITKVVLNNNITVIPKGAFANCAKLVSVVGANEITDIEYAAFKGCGKLTDIGKMEKLTSIKRAAFWEDNNLALTINSAMDIDDNALSGTLYDTTVKLTVPDNDPVYAISDGLLIKTNGVEKTVIMQM